MRAFSLIEVMVAGWILEVVAALAVPSVTNLVSTARARESAQSVSAILEEARTRAAAEGRCFRVRANSGGTTGTGLVLERRNSADCVNLGSDGWDTVRTDVLQAVTVAISSTLAPGGQNEIVFRPNDRLRGDGVLPHDAAHQNYGSRIQLQLKNGRVAVVDITAQGRLCSRIATSAPPALAAPVVCP